MDRGKVYGHRRAVRDLYEAATAAARDLRGQLEALNQQAHQRPVDGDDLEAARGLLFADHGWG